MAWWNPEWTTPMIVGVSVVAVLIGACFLWRHESERQVTYDGRVLSKLVVPFPAGRSAPDWQGNVQSWPAGTNYVVALQYDGRTQDYYVGPEEYEAFAEGDPIAVVCMVTRSGRCRVLKSVRKI